MFCTIKKAYEIFKLEDPILFQNKILDQYIERFEKDICAKENFLYLRGTGKSTYYMVEAAIYLLSGRDILYFCKDNKLTVKHQINKFLHILIKNSDPGTAHSIGELNVEKVISPKYITERLTGISNYNYYIIFDIY